jgi:hypothetical protein
MVLAAWLVILLVGIRSRRKRENEKHLIPLLSESCGIRYKDIRLGSFNLTKPLARCSIYDDFILLAFGGRAYVINFEKLKSFEIKKFSISTGIVLNHSINSFPKELVIWPKGNSLIIEVLNEKVSSDET